MSTKTNPGPYDCYADAADDEPIFTLRARDPLAPILVELWVRMRQLARPLHKKPSITREAEKRTEALACAADMVAWSHAMFWGEKIAPK